MWVGLQGSGGRLAHARVVLWIAEVPGGSVLPCIQRCYTLHCIYPVRITPDPVKNHEDKHSCVRKENSCLCGLKSSCEMSFDVLDSLMVKSPLEECACFKTHAEGTY